MTTMDYTTTLRALKWLMVETGSLACLGCGHENSCSVHGCAILRNAVEHMEAALANYDHLSALVDQRDADINLHTNVNGFKASALGKTVFLPREEAEAALKGGDEE